MPAVPRAGAWALRRLAWSVTAGGATTCPAACRRRPDAARSNSSRSLPFSSLRGPPSPVRANHRLPLTHSVDRGRADGMARRVSCHIGATASNVKPMTCANANGVPRVASIWHEMPIVGARPCPRGGGGGSDAGRGRLSGPGEVGWGEVGRIEWRRGVDVGPDGALGRSVEVDRSVGEWWTRPRIRVGPIGCDGHHFRDKRGGREGSAGDDGV